MRGQSLRRLGAAAALLLLLGAVVLVVEHYRTPEAWWDTFLVGDPHSGSHVFQEKGCSHCHAVNGAGASRAPDLGYQRPARSTLHQLVTEMWNHAPRMWEAMEAERIAYPSFSARETADLIAFLYSVRYFDLGGSAVIGRQLFVERKCGDCHRAEGDGGEHGLQLRGRGRFFAPVTLARALWAHGPQMYRRSQELGLGWPTLQEGDLAHLLAFLNTLPEETR